MRRRRKSEPNVYNIAVSAVAVSTSNYGPGVLDTAPEGDASTRITIEGKLDRPAYEELQTALVQVCRGNTKGVQCGATLPGELAWNVVIWLPSVEFSDLLVMGLSGGLTSVRLVTEKVHRGKARVLSASFGTVPVPSEVESGI
jgi:hypothetical protein